MYCCTFLKGLFYIISGKLYQTFPCYKQPSLSVFSAHLLALFIDGDQMCLIRASSAFFIIFTLLTLKLKRQANQRKQICTPEALFSSRYPLTCSLRNENEHLFEHKRKKCSCCPPSSPSNIKQLQSYALIDICSLFPCKTKNTALCLKTPQF